MRPLVKVLVLAAAALAAAGPVAAKPRVSAAVAAAVADPARPEGDTMRDAARHPAELMAFAGVKPGWKVADYIPGGGYFTRIFAKAVGPSGHVFATFPEGFANFAKADVASIQQIAADAAYPNVSFATTPNETLNVSEPLDLVWTSLNYHDLQFNLTHDQIIALDKSIYAALKPGGVFVVVDHVAAPGTGWTVARRLHRIEPAAIKADMAAAGFKLEAESPILRNPADPHTATVFDPSIRGHTDQVVLRFRKRK